MSLKCKRRLVILTVVLMLFFIKNISYAHPGRTDANGGHTCRTNCEKWGLEYGEYHYHNGAGSHSTNKSSEKSKSQPKSSPAVDYIIRGAIVFWTCLIIYVAYDKFKK